MADYLTRLFNLPDKVAVVIGAAGHLCSEMALALAAAGVRVMVLDRSLEGARGTVQRIHSIGGEAEAGLVDVVDRTSHERALAATLDRFGQVDILINGAGINAPTPIFEIALEEWNAIIATHVTGTFLACQVFGRHMVDRRTGSIINISSASAGPPLSKAFAYSVAKAGVKNLTQNLAREWAPHGVRVNALRPGFFPTAWSMEHFITPGRAQAILNHTPMRRYGQPHELIGAVLWLASDAAGFVTGAEITVDGGFSAMTI